MRTRSLGPRTNSDQSSSAWAKVSPVLPGVDSGRGGDTHAGVHRTARSVVRRAFKGPGWVLKLRGADGCFEFGAFWSTGLGAVGNMPLGC